MLYQEVKQHSWQKRNQQEWHHYSWRKFFSKRTKLLSIGSCFAVNFSRWIRLQGVTVLNPEWGMHYNLPTIYREFQHASGKKIKNIIWNIEGKRGAYYIDGNRHPIHASTLEKLKETHLKIVKDSHKALRTADVILITLGLSEVWEEKVGDEWVTINRTPPEKIYNKERHKCRNLTVKESKEHLQNIIRLIRRYNKNADVVFSVSPIPLKTSFCDMNIKISNLRSKMTLLTALSEYMDECKETIIYFPSFDIFMDSADRAKWFQLDERHFSAKGIEYFCKKFIEYFAIHPDEFQHDIDFKVPLVDENGLVTEAS